MQLYFEMPELELVNDCYVNIYPSFLQLRVFTPA